MGQKVEYRASLALALCPRTQAPRVWYNSCMFTDVRSGLVLVAVTAWRQVLEIGPYVAAGVVLAAALGQLDPPQRWRRILRRGRPLPVVGAACLGGASPIPTYGTVPILLQILRVGGSPGPALAFVAASSMMNPQFFLIVLGGLGARLALAQVAGVLALSAGLGVATSVLPRGLFIHPTAVSGEEPSEAARSGFSWSALGRDLLSLGGWIGFTFVIGVILAAAIQVFVPPHWVTTLLGEGRWAGVLLAGVLGIPLYHCGGSAVPVLAGLLQMGMNPSAVLAFLLSGPATRVTSLAAMGSVLNRRALLAYLGYVVAGAVVVGLLLA